MAHAQTMERVASGDDEGASSGSSWPWLPVVVWAALAVPLLVALWSLHSPRFFPIGDIAQTELRVRDVGTANPPMMGLVGRLGTLRHPGSHPGPISFYLLAPVYRLLGGSSFALNVSTVTLNLAAFGLAIWLAWRRAGRWGVLAFGSVAIWLARSYGHQVLTPPWNPYLPVLWWLVALLAIWSVLCDDDAMLPVAVLAGSFCAQTHLPYLGLIGGLVVFTVAPVALWAWRRRGRHDTKRHLLRWVLVSVALGVLLWLPPIIQQLANDPGNLTVIRDSLTNHEDPALGFGSALKVLLQNLNPLAMLTHREPSELNVGDATIVPGLLLILAWLGSTVVAWRLRHERLLRLDAVLGAALVLGVVSIARIYGDVWQYLLLFSWGLAALLVMATVWTAVEWWRTSERAPLETVALVVGCAAIVVGSASFTVDNVGAEVDRADLSAVLGDLSHQTMAYLDDPSGIGGGRDGRYLLAWTDPIYISSLGYGMLNDLEREGIDVGVPALYDGGALEHRVLDPKDATARLQVVVGPEIVTWRTKPGAKQIAYVETRTPAQVREYQRLAVRVQRRLTELGKANIDFQNNLFVYGYGSLVPPDVSRLILRMLDIGLPSAVFVAPVSTT